MRRLCLISYGLVTRLSRVVRCCVLLTIGRWTTLIEFRSSTTKSRAESVADFQYADLSLLSRAWVPITFFSWSMGLCEIVFGAAWS
ncbi:hypothetical protein BKA82DRAFT_4198674 [Pisolithus tinctorius]|nr:hypothetical protein BKA82DRAFT_4198674 [Pisolithus tinctorius]